MSEVMFKTSRYSASFFLLQFLHVFRCSADIKCVVHQICLSSVSVIYPMMIQFAGDRQHPGNDEWPAVLPVHQITSFLCRKHFSLPHSRKSHSIDMKWLFWTFYFFSLALICELQRARVSLRGIFQSTFILQLVDNGPHSIRLSD